MMTLPNDILRLIASYIIKPKYKLRSWIDSNKLNWKTVSQNVNAANLLEENFDKADICELYWNHNTFPIIQKHWNTLNQNIKYVNFVAMSFNPYATELLEKYLDKVCWQTLSSNPNAISILEANLDKVDWYSLSSNPNTLHILEANLDRINWKNFCRNRNPRAIHLLEKHLYEDISWYMLSSNPNAIPILEQNLPRHEKTFSDINKLKNKFKLHKVAAYLQK